MKNIRIWRFLFWNWK